jgi:hypothetical protein
MVLFSVPSPTIISGECLYILANSRLKAQEYDSIGLAEIFRLTGYRELDMVGMSS